MTGLELRRIGLAIGGTTLIRDLSLTIPPRAIVTVMGPSGSGKSSLLAYIGGYLAPAFAASGRVLLNGADITRLPPHRRRAGILFQDALLFPHMSVGANLGFGLRPGGSRAERRARIAAALREAELEGFADRDPATLSGGQRARVALMRTLLSEPAVLLLDEPFARLDADLRQRFRQFVFDHARARDLPMLLVTHDAADAAAAGGPLVRLPHG
ncbi:MAG TPA: ATP-binding cassette domain-containing protein [Ferrovibrio sp.]|uniref:ATP-binding cassette domain-containing protein n=1 Tax=Ferrovibrio sp. TaxID=1917215 RepID=UPI002ED371A6